MKHKRSMRESHKQSLGDQIVEPGENGVRSTPRKKSRRAGTEVDDDEATAVDPAQSAAILSLAKSQQQEEQRDASEAAPGAGLLGAAVAGWKPQASSDSDDEDDAREWAVGDRELSDTEDIVVDDLDAFQAEDEAAFNAFMHGGAAAPGCGDSLLADVVMAKVQAAKLAAAAARDGQVDAEPSGLNDEMAAICADVGKLLSRYTTGKLPKAFKIVPHLRNWEEAVFAMDPEGWSPHATYAATKMFVSQLNARQTQRFLNLILLNKVRDDVREHKRLHFALFQALKKAVFKPGAFYKGVVLPLLKCGDCTLREAVIISSVISRVSIPVDHSAAALLKMAEMPYSGVTSFFMKALLEKKYTLPYRVIDALVDTFVSFRHEERAMPVIWHLSLLTFAQRYKHEIRPQDKLALKALLKVQHHRGVSPEVMRELDHGQARGTASRRQAQHFKLTSGAGEDAFNMAPMLVDE